MGRGEDPRSFDVRLGTVQPAGVSYLPWTIEGWARNNLAYTLLELQRYDEARREIVRAIECDKPFGHSAEPWKTFAILSNLEHDVGNATAAALARQQAFSAYLAYRRDGGENHNLGGRLALAVGEAIVAGAVDDLSSQLAQLTAHPNLPDSLRTMIPALQAILSGSRDPSLASDPALDFDDAAKLTLLLESLP